MARKLGTCEGCGERRPVEGHHITPLNYGGPKDGPLAYICASCHDIIHNEAEHFYKHGKSTTVLVELMAKNRRVGTNIANLSVAIIKAKQAFASGDVGVGEQRRMTQISWDSDEERLMAHAVKTSLGFKSLERAIKHLVREAYIKTLEN